MINDELTKELKAFILKNYVLIEEPVFEETPGLPSATLRKTLGKITVGADRPSGRSFEDLTNILTGFIKKERKPDTFSTMLEELRTEKGMTAAQLYNGAWVRKQLYSKIMGDRNYHPSKNTVIAFGLSLKLDREYMDKLLEIAGYRFSNSSIADLVIIFCIEKGLYDISNVNAMLFSADQKVLCRE